MGDNLPVFFWIVCLREIRHGCLPVRILGPSDVFFSISLKLVSAGYSAPIKIDRGCPPVRMEGPSDVRYIKCSIPTDFVRRISSDRTECSH